MHSTIQLSLLVLAHYRTVMSRSLQNWKLCSMYGYNHSIADCPSFKVLDFTERASFVAKNDLCSNCFGEHQVTNCLYVPRCKYCKDMNHSLLHPHLSDIQHSDEHHCSESGSFDSTEQILNKTLQNTFCTRAEYFRLNGNFPCDCKNSYRAVLSWNSSVMKPIRVLIKFDKFAFKSFKHVRLKRSLRNQFSQLESRLLTAQQLVICWSNPLNLKFA